MWIFSYILSCLVFLSSVSLSPYSPYLKLSAPSVSLPSFILPMIYSPPRLLFSTWAFEYVGGKEQLYTHLWPHQLQQIVSIQWSCKWPRLNQVAHATKSEVMILGKGQVVEGTTSWGGTRWEREGGRQEPGHTIYVYETGKKTNNKKKRNHWECLAWILINTALRFFEIMGRRNLQGK